MIEGLLSLLGAASDGLGLFSGITSLVRGNHTREQLNRIQASLTGISLQVEQLADRILYVTNMPAVRDITKSRQEFVNDLKKARQFLQPVQQSLGDDLLASSIIATPQKLARAIGKDPFDLLLDTRPIHRAAIHPNMIPIMFHDSGQAYLGWQSRNGLENMFDTQCDNLWLPFTIDSPPAGVPEDQLLCFYDERGQRRFHSGDFEGALADFKNALKFIPDMDVYHIWIAKAASRLGRKHEASTHKLWAKRLNARNINRDVDAYLRHCKFCKEVFGGN